MKHKLTPDQRNHMRLRLSQARADALADGEAAEAVIYAIEEVGRIVSGKEQPLGTLAASLLDRVKTELSSRHDDLQRRLLLLIRGRNERMHRGFAARNLAADAVHVALILEEWLKVDWEKLTAADVMTPHPMEAKQWHTFGMVRDAIVANSYSHIPILWQGSWKVISERSMYRVVQQARKLGIDLRSKKLSDNIPKLKLKLNGSLGDQLTDRQTLTVSPDAPVTSLNLETGCLLVVRAGTVSQLGELLGIITPADVL